MPIIRPIQLPASKLSQNPVDIIVSTMEKPNNYYAWQSHCVKHFIAHSHSRLDRQKKKILRTISLAMMPSAQRSENSLQQWKDMEKENFVYNDNWFIVFFQ